MFNKLASRLILAFAVVSLFPTLLTLFDNTNSTLALSVNEAQTRQREITRVVRDEVSTFLTGFASNLTLLATQYAQVDTPARISLARDLARAQVAWREIATMNAEGREQFKIVSGEVVAESELADNRELEFYRQASRLPAGGVYYSSVRYLADTPFLIIAAPVYDRTGALTNILAGRFTLNSVWQVVTDLTLGNGGYAYLTDSRGSLIVYRDRRANEQRAAFAALPAIDAALRGKPGVFEYQSPIGGTVYGAAEAVPVVGWTLATERLTADVLEPYVFARNRSIVLAALFLVGALALAVVLATNLSTPLVALARSVKAFGDGQTQARTVIRRRDEIGQLANAFNRMADLQVERIRDAEASRTKAEEASRVKNTFLASMSHELRTPLNSIIGFTDMLEEGMLGPVNEKQKTKLGRMRVNAGRLLGLINDILDLSKLEADRVEIEKAPIRIKSLIETVAEQMSVLAEAKHLDFSASVQPSMPELLVGDAERLAQIIVNLVGNAIKFTDKGSVALTVDKTSAQEWQISVRDTGSGIAPHAHDLIFEQFRQVDGSSTRRHKGTGLGLAITRNLVHLMHGSVTIESEGIEGKGSCFMVRLPLVVPEQTPEPA